MLHFEIVVNKSRNTIGPAVRAQRSGRVEATDPADRAVPSGPGSLRPLNARSLALSILLGSHPPQLPARSLVALAELFDIPAGTMRTALSRMLAAGEVDAADGRYRLAGRLIERQGAQDVGRHAPVGVWDGRWHTIVAVEDQRDLAERRQFRATMANHRFGELRPDIWTRPSNLGDPPTEPGWLVTTGPLLGIDGHELAGRLWDLDVVATTTRELLAEMAALRSARDWSDPASIPELFTTSAAVVRFLRHEPLLPVELTPPGWPVDELRNSYDDFEADHQRLLQQFLRRA